MFDHGHRHLFEILGVREFVRAAELLRKLDGILGLTKLDAVLDHFKVTSLIKAILDKLGIPQSTT